MWSSKQGRAFILHNPLPHKPPIDFSRGSVHGLLMRYDPSQLVFGSTFFCVLIKISLWFTQSRKFLLLPLPTWFKTTSCVIWVAFLTVRLTVSWWWCQWLGPSRSIALLVWSHSEWVILCERSKCINSQWWRHRIELLFVFWIWL